MSDDNESTLVSDNSLPPTPEMAEAMSLIDHLKAGKTIHDNFAKQFRDQYKIAGRLMEQWMQHFHIQVPPDLSPPICRNIDRKLIELHEEATFLEAEAEARKSACENATTDKYEARVAQLVKEYELKDKRLPAKDTLAALANQEVQHLRSAVHHAEIELEFWKKILNNLANCRKVIENATVNLTSEAKAMQNERFLDRLNNRSATSGDDAFDNTYGRNR